MFPSTNPLIYGNHPFWGCSMMFNVVKTIFFAIFQITIGGMFTIPQSWVVYDIVLTTSNFHSKSWYSHYFPWFFPWVFARVFSMILHDFPNENTENPKRVPSQLHAEVQPLPTWLLRAQPGAMDGRGLVENGWFMVDMETIINETTMVNTIKWGRFIYILLMELWQFHWVIHWKMDIQLLEMMIFNDGP